MVQAAKSAVGRGCGMRQDKVQNGSGEREQEQQSKPPAPDPSVPGLSQSRPEHQTLTSVPPAASSSPPPGPRQASRDGTRAGAARIREAKLGDATQCPVEARPVRASMERALVPWRQRARLSPATIKRAPPKVATMVGTGGS